jgi:hypothetical protein
MGRVNRRWSIFAAVVLLSASGLQRAQNASPGTDQIVRACVKEMRKSVRLRSAYTYKILDEKKDLNRAGKVEDTHRTLTEVMYFAGKPFERTLQKDGKPLPPGEEKREEEKMNRTAEEASRLTDAEREARQEKLDRQREKDSEWFQFFPEAYRFTAEPEISLNGRRTYVLDAEPQPGYRGKYANILSKARCKLFIDEKDFTLARIEAQVLQPITFGLFLARLSEGTRITFEQVRVNDEVWLPKTATVHASARALVKSYRFDEHLEFSDYRKFQSESKIVAVGEE